MKNLFRSTPSSMFRKLALMTLFAIGGLFFQVGKSHACNLSSFSLLSIIPATPDTFINFQVCIGGGRTGAVLGADQGTGTFAITFSNTGGAMLPTTTINSFSPADVTGTGTGCTMPGLNFGPDPMFGFVNTLIYVDPGYYGVMPCATTSFTCTNSTALCGNAATQCINFSVLVDRIPDSICARGIEGGGNFIAGCQCNSMGFPLREGILNVVWGEISAELLTEHIKVSWQSLSETGDARYHLQRQVQGGDFVEITSMRSAGSSHAPLDYSYNDPNEGLQGEVNYRIQYVDQNGRGQYSNIVSVQLPITSNFAVRSIYPLPAQDVVHCNLIAVTASKLDWTLIDAMGKAVDQGKANLPSGETTLSLDLGQLRAGNYYLQCNVGGETVTHRVVKL